MKKIFNWLFKGRLKPVVIDADKLSEKAQEFAMKGALSVVEEYYTGYNSPFKKALMEELEGHKVAWRMELPDIMALINDSLSAEITKIANTAIATNFVPMVNSFLTRAEKTMKFSEILREFVKLTDASDISDLSCDIETKDDGSFSHKYVTLSHENEVWKFNLLRYLSSGSVDKGHSLTGLPTKNESKDRYSVPAQMKLMVDNVKLEIPFTQNVLNDSFTAFLARLLMSGTKITFDTDDFDEDMIERDHCTC